MTNQDERLNGEIWLECERAFGYTKMPHKFVFETITTKARQQGAEAERKRINEIIKSVIYEKFEEDGFYKYYSDKVIQSILSQLKNSEAK